MAQGNALRKSTRQYKNYAKQGIVNNKTNGMPNVIAVGSIDYTALLVISMLLLIGIVMVFSASYYNAGTWQLYGFDMFYFLKKHIPFAIIGFCVMISMSNFNYRYLMRFGFPLYMVSNVLLLCVLIMSVAVKGAKRWIALPIIGKFQPSELSKIAIIIFVSFIIYKRKDILNTWKGFIAVSGIVMFTGILVCLGNLSTAIIVCIIGFGIIYVASPHILRFVVMACTAAGGMAFYLAVLSNNFRGERVDAWLDPFADPKGFGFQIIQSLYAVASGGIFGLGIGQSRQKSFIPEPHNDFIFSIICEELGLVGAGVVLLLFGILIWRGIKIAMNATDLFGSLVATGIVLMIASQTIINVAVVTNTIPNTGVTIPLISYGGTSLLVTMFLLGILLNISRYSNSVRKAK